MSLKLPGLMDRHDEPVQLIGYLLCQFNSRIFHKHEDAGRSINHSEAGSNHSRKAHQLRCVLSQHFFD